MASKNFLNKKCGIIGAGRFGRAFIQGVLSANIFSRESIFAAERAPEASELASQMGIKVFQDFSEFASEPEFWLLSVKPAQVDEVLTKLKVLPLHPSAVLISVCAGTSTAKLEAALGQEFPIIRAMPNSPCSIQSGFTAICPGRFADDSDMRSVREIFRALGQCEEVPERLFDWVTALSGSGPAYFYRFMEIMIEAGKAAGLAEETAVNLVSQTALGAALMVQKTNRDPESLRKEVATPGGCTIAALKILEDRNLETHFRDALKEAARVASELGGPSKPV